MHFGELRRVAIVGSARIPFCRAFTSYSECSNQDMMTAALKGLVEKFNLGGERLGEVALGAVMMHTRDWNIARESALGSGLSPTTPAFDIRRACGTGLEAAILVGNKIALGQIDSGIAGGMDSISAMPLFYPDDYQRIMMASSRGRSFAQKMKPLLGLRPRHLKPKTADVTEPRTHLSMGQSTELTAKHWNITREEQDGLAYTSHIRAAAAWEQGFYDDLVVPFSGAEKDNNVRADTSMQKLAVLKPVFDRSESGTLTPGNSSALTDGAGAVLLATEDWARQRGLPILAYLRCGKAAAVDFLEEDRNGLLMAPTIAVSDMLRMADLKFSDMDFFEIHEAFAAQALATLKAWESPEYCRERLGRSEPLGPVDREKMNLKGGSVAIGHPFGATGGRLLGTLAKLIDENGGGRGLISICTGGGMGVAAVVEK